MKVVVSIVEYNTEQLLKNCLNSILNKKWQNDIEVWVADNASSDNSVKMIKQNFPHVKLIESKKNLGFAGGHNLVLKKAKADYYLILNSDTLLLDDVIDKMVKFMEDNPNCGIASCKVLGFDGHLQPNGGDLPLGLSLLVWLFNLETLGIYKPSFHRNDEDYYQSSHQVGWVSGNFMMIKREVLGKVGFLNDDYFMYFEDVEYCYKTKKIGFGVMIDPRVSIKHLSGGSLDDPKFRQWSGEFRGLLYFYRKEFGQLSEILLKGLIYFSSILRIIAFILTGKSAYAKTYGKVIATI